MNWLPEVLPPASSAATQIDAIIRRHWTDAETLRRVSLRTADSSNPALYPYDFNIRDRAFRVACVEVTMWRDMRPQPDGLSPLEGPRDYKDLLGLALSGLNGKSACIRELFERPARITASMSELIAATHQVCVGPPDTAASSARILELAKALKSRYPTMGKIEPHMRYGVLVLFHAYAQRFAGDLRFASDADEAAGLVVDACLSLFNTLYQQRAEALNGGGAAGGAREQESGPPVGSGLFVGADRLGCRYCGSRRPVGQGGEGVNVKRDGGGVLREKETEPRKETRVDSDEEEESDWTTI